MSEGYKSQRRMRLVAVTSLLLFISSVQGLAGGVAWNFNYDLARSRAQIEGKLVLIYFEQSSADRSDKMNRETWNQQPIIDLCGKFICVKIDFERTRMSLDLAMKDRNERAALDFRITFLPTTIVADPFGNTLARVEDYRTVEEVRKLLAPLPPDLSTLYELLHSLQREPDQPRLLFEVAEAFAGLKIPEISNRYFQRLTESGKLMQDSLMAERVHAGMALNQAALGNLTGAIAELELCLDLKPDTTERPRILFLLTRYLLDSLNEDAAAVYADFLRKEFPGSPYRRMADQLFEARR